MWDGSAMVLAENLAIAAELLNECAAAGIVLERPQVLKDVQDAVGATVGKQRPLDLVFHGGSGSSHADIRESLTHGVVKTNIDTDTQYAFTRAVAHHAFTNYAGVLKLDGELGDKKAYDPRAYGKLAEAAMAARVAQDPARLRKRRAPLALGGGVAGHAQ